MKLRKAAAVILAMLMVLSALPASWADSLLPCRHQWSSWKTVTEATCASAGKQYDEQRDHSHDRQNNEYSARKLFIVVLLNRFCVFHVETLPAKLF